jgi:hypothetical protein
VERVTRTRWRELAPSDRLELVREVSADWAEVEVVDAPVSWEVVARSRVRRPPGEEGHLLMAYEAHLRSTLGLPIEVYSPPVGDSSKLRQKLQRERGGEVEDWFARREATRRLGTGE